MIPKNDHGQLKRCISQLMMESLISLIVDLDVGMVTVNICTLHRTVDLTVVKIVHEFAIVKTDNR
jgi:hypothetical protein